MSPSATSLRAVRPRAETSGAQAPLADEPQPGASPPASKVPIELEVLATHTRRQFTREFKQRIVREAASCKKQGELGALLRREGLYSSHLATWRKQLGQPARKRGRRPLDPALIAQMEENRRLRQEKSRLERRLANAETVIEIQKKVSELLGIPLNAPDPAGSD